MKTRHAIFQDTDNIGRLISELHYRIQMGVQEDDVFGRGYVPRRLARMVVEDLDFIAQHAGATIVICEGPIPKRERPNLWQRLFWRKISYVAEGHPQVLANFLVYAVENRI